MASDDDTGDLVELRPAPAVVLRHRDADLEVHTAPRTGPRVELRRGALWIRAGEEGPGVTVTHGATSVQVRAGAGVLEVLDMEALLVVASGRAAVKGVSPLPRSVIAGQAVTLTLDGTFTDPDALSAAELAADRMVVENLALDSLASTAPAPAPSTGDPAPPVGDPGVPAGARVDPPGAPQVEGTADPFAPRVRPEPAPEPQRASEEEPGEPAPERPPVGRPAPAAPPVEPSALETALFGVGVTDAPPEPGSVRTPAVPPAAPADDDTAPRSERTKTPKVGKAKGPKAKTAKTAKTAKPDKAKGAKAKRSKGAKGKGPRAAAADDDTEGADPVPPDDDRRRQRILIALVLGALLILAVVAAVAFGADAAPALAP